MSRPAKIVFTFSLILNVLFLGLAVGQVYHETNEPRPWDETKAALAPQTRDVLKTTFMNKKKEIVPLFEAARDKKDAMKAIITAPELDGEAYDALAKELMDLNGQFMEHRLMTIKAIFSQVPQEERKKMAEHTVEKILGNPPHGKGGRTIHYRQTKRFHSSGRINSDGRVEITPDKEPLEVEIEQNRDANQEQ